MDLSSKVLSLEEISLRNPFDKNSIKKLTKILEDYKYEDLIYKKECYIFNDYNEMTEPPRMVFIPCARIIRQMVLANLLFA
jgi:hypothetical protein